MRLFLLLPLLAACGGSSEPAAPTGDPHWMTKVKPWYCASEPLKTPNLVPSGPRPTPPAPAAAPGAGGAAPGTPAPGTPAPGTASPTAAPASPTAAPASPAPAALAGTAPASPTAAPASPTLTPAGTPTAGTPTAAAPAPDPAAPKSDAALPEPTARSIALKFTGKAESLYGTYAIWGGARDRIIGKLTRFERQAERVGKLLWETDKRQKGDVTLTFAEDFGTVTVVWKGDPAGFPTSTTFTASDDKTCPAAALIR